MPIRPSSRFHAVNLALWALYALVSIAMGRAFAGGTTSGYVLIAVTLSVLLWIASLHLRGLATRRGWFRREPGALAWRLAVAVALHAAVVQIGVAAVLVPSLRMGWASLPANATPYSTGAAIGYWINTVIVLAMWTGGWAGWRLLRRARESELASLRAESARSALELDALRARLNPHFVFNALNNLRALILEDPDRARELVTRLSSTLRHALEHSQRDWTTLGEELAVVRDYLAVEQVHYEERLQPRVQVPDALLAAKVPPLALQLLVENAIKHGIACTAGGGALDIDASVANGRLRIRVANPGRLDAGGEGTGVGLAFLTQRLERMGGRFSLASRDGMVLATLDLPA